MSNTKLTTEELLIQEKVKNYIINSEELINLQQRFEKMKNLDSNGIAQYGTQMVSSNLPSSKVENMVIQKMIIEEQIKNISQELAEISYAIDQLQGLKKIIVDQMILGTKLSDVGRRYNLTRKKIDLLKKRAFREMYESICKYRNTK